MKEARRLVVDRRRSVPPSAFVGPLQEPMIALRCTGCRRLLSRNCDRRGPVCFSSSSNKSPAKKQGLFDAAKARVAEVASSAANNAKKEIRDASRKASEAAAKEGQKYAGEALRLASRAGETLKQSAKSTAHSANKRVRESASELVQTTRERVANQLPAKQKVIDSASTIASETVRRTKSSAASQVNDAISNATRWFWWWSLAAIGVYGVSTTLTKEGVSALKEALSTPASKATDEAVGLSTPTSDSSQ